MCDAFVEDPDAEYNIICIRLFTVKGKSLGRMLHIIINVV